MVEYVEKNVIPSIFYVFGVANFLCKQNVNEVCAKLLQRDQIYNYVMVLFSVLVKKYAEVKNVLRLIDSSERQNRDFFSIPCFFPPYLFIQFVVCMCTYLFLW